MKRRFLIDTDVENASGTQTWYVDANSKEEALELHEAGKSEFYSQEVEVTSIGPPEISGEVSLDDFGDEKAAQPLTKEKIEKVLAALEINRSWFIGNFGFTTAHPVVVNNAKAIEIVKGML